MGLTGFIRFMGLIAFAAIVLARPGVAAAQAVRVELQERAGRYALSRDGQPFFIRGAGGQSRLDALVESGGNSIRTWGADNAREVLDLAHAKGLTVTMGIWLGHPRHGFDYKDPAAVAAQLDMVRRVVEANRDHPALLMWGLGNELELESDPLLVFPEIERAARLVASLDPNHPRMTVIAGPRPEKIRAFVDLCPSIDVLGVNAYGDAPEIPTALRESGYTGPYVVTEFGPRGWWESQKAPWGAPIEPTGSEKAAMYASAYRRAVLAEPSRCLGSYVFLWGHKQETTATWFGMFLEDGGRTPTVDAMRELWSGRPAPNRAPLVDGIDTRVALQSVRPGVEFEAAVRVTDPDADPISIAWLVIAESSDRRSGGDAEAAPPALPSLTLRDGQTMGRFRAPEEPGAYRLFVFVRDGHGGVGTANVPFLVDG